MNNSFVANDASFGTLPYRMLSYLVYQCLQQILFLILSTICGTRAVEAISCVQKKKETFQDLIETDSHECATINCLYTPSEKLKSIDHMLLKFA